MANVYGTNGDDKITATETSRTAWSNGSVDGYFAMPGWETLFEGKVTVQHSDNSWTTEVGQFWAGDPARDGHRDYVADIYAADGDDRVELGKKFQANMDAGSGNDWVKIHSGSVIGGSGTDILDLSGFTSGSFIDLRDHNGVDVDRTATFNDGGTITYRTDIEGVIGTPDTLGPTDTGTSDGTVICTHMFKNGYIPADVFQWDHHYGARVLGPTIIRGYHAWAIPFVRHVLEQSETATRLCAPMAQAWAQEMAHRCDPDTHPKGKLLGKVILGLGVPLCWSIGKTLDAAGSRGAARST